MDGNVGMDHLDNPIDWFDENDPLIATESAIPSVVEMEFLNLSEGTYFNKIQSRKGGTPKQVLENAVIEMKATYGPEPLLCIKGWIRREPEAARLCGDANHDVLLCQAAGRELNLVEKNNIPVPAIDPRYMSQLFSVDLGKVYDGPQQPVFQLAKTDTNARNRFQLLIQLKFLHRDDSEIFVSPTFNCRTKPAPKPKRPLAPSSSSPPHDGEPSPSRPRVGSTSTFSDPYSVSTSTPGSYYGPGSVSSIGAPASPSNLIVDNLKAQTAVIGSLVVESIGTPNADIAYHLKVEDPEKCAGLEEGDVVGFYTDPNDGTTFIKPLEGGDIKNAVHAGVISRSHYIAGHKPMDNKIATDTVCVIGIVNVKVIGSVQNGERIYASMNYPGKAVPQSHLPISRFSRKQHFLLGMALESKFSISFEHEHLVKCFVCIVLDISRKEIQDEVERMCKMTEKLTSEHVRRSQKKTYERLGICLGFLIIFAALFSFFLYQVLVPGSMFRYWLCRQGSISGHDLDFNFVPLKDKTTEYHAHGILFTFDGLRKKVSDHFYRNTRNDTGGTAYYYLNLDRCAYFGDYGPVGNSIGGHKNIGGGKILTVNHDCTIVYYFGYNTTVTKNVWDPYISRKNVVCDPLPPFKISNRT